MSAAGRPIRVGVAGLGYWGPNLARNFAAIPGCELAWLCDASEQARERVAPLFPAARTTASSRSCSATTELDAVVLATPVPTHAELAVAVLEPASTASSRSRSRRARRRRTRRWRRPRRTGGS